MVRIEKLQEHLRREGRVARGETGAVLRREVAGLGGEPGALGSLGTPSPTAHDLVDLGRAARLGTPAVRAGRATSGALIGQEIDVGRARRPPLQRSAHVLRASLRQAPPAFGPSPVLPVPAGATAGGLLASRRTGWRGWRGR